MKKTLIILMMMAVGFGVYWSFFRNKGGSSAPPPKPLSITSNSTVFSGSFEHILNAYYILKEAFVKSDTSAVNIATSQFHSNLDSLNMKELKADTALIKTAQTLKESILAEVLAMMKASDLEEKRKSFQIISDMMYDLIRTVKYDKAMVYQLHCPMAFDNAGANWLSNKDEVINPYFGNKMLHCGEVIDSVDYRPAPVEQKK